MTKGVEEQLKKDMPQIDARKTSKDVASGVADGIAEHGKDIGHGARDLGRELAAGFLGEVRVQMGANGKGPLATSLTAAGANGTQELVHAVGVELSNYLPQCQSGDRSACIDAMIQKYAYESSNAAARGAAAAASPYGSLLMAGAGFGAGLLTAALIAMLLSQRKTNRALAALNPRIA